LALPITGTNIPANTYLIASSGTGSSVTLSQTPTGTVSGAVLWTNPLTPLVQKLKIGLGTTGMSAAGYLYPTALTPTTITINASVSQTGTQVTFNYAT
jgi:hypothetical protein